MSTRREFIKWVAYVGAALSLPAFASVEQFPHDVLEGISRVNKKLADGTYNNVAYRAAEDEAFEHAMLLTWQQQNGTARYLRVFKDLGTHPAYKWRDEDGEVHDEPEAYVTFFQYRRA